MLINIAAFGVPVFMYFLPVKFIDHFIYFRLIGSEKIISPTGKNSICLCSSFYFGKKIIEPEPMNGSSASDQIKMVIIKTDFFRRRNMIMQIWFRYRFCNLLFTNISCMHFCKIFSKSSGTLSISRSAIECYAPKTRKRCDEVEQFLRILRPISGVKLSPIGEVILETQNSRFRISAKNRCARSCSLIAASSVGSSARFESYFLPNPFGTFDVVPDFAAFFFASAASLRLSMTGVGFVWTGCQLKVSDPPTCVHG